MKEKEVINQLHLLQSVQPENRIVQVIRKQVRSPYAVGDGLGLKRGLPIVPMMYTLVFASIVIIVTLTWFPYFVENTITTARIALFANHYEKAKISLAKVDEQMSLLHNNDTNTIVTFSHTLALANTQLSELRLVGEKGKYTSYQCLDLYESYHKDLEKIQNTVHPDKNNNADSLLTQAKQYDASAIAKLKKYHREPYIDKEN
jgi:hypothetical protein